MYELPAHPEEIPSWWRVIADRLSESVELPTGLRSWSTSRGSKLSTTCGSGSASPRRLVRRR